MYWSDCFLVRKAHNSGRNHLSNVRDYYACKKNFADYIQRGSNFCISTGTRQGAEHYRPNHCGIRDERRSPSWRIRIRATAPWWPASRLWRSNGFRWAHGAAASRLRWSCAIHISLFFLPLLIFFPPARPPFPPNGFPPPMMGAPPFPPNGMPMGPPGGFPGGALSLRSSFK
jgi:U1 small nuclear ribonucleoprotein C